MLVYPNQSSVSNNNVILAGVSKQHTWRYQQLGEATLGISCILAGPMSYHYPDLRRGPQKWSDLACHTHWGCIEHHQGAPYIWYSMHPATPFWTSLIKSLLVCLLRMSSLKCNFHKLCQDAYFHLTFSPDLCWAILPFQFCQYETILLGFLWGKGNMIT
jgi:hypothetical protein